MAPFSKNEMKEMLNMFLSEGKENLQIMEQQIQSLEKEPNNNYALLELYRIVHSFKGMAGTVGLPEFEKFFHTYEGLISLIQERKISINNEKIDLFFEILDILDISLNKLEENKDTKSIFDGIILKIQNVKESSNLPSETNAKSRMKQLFQESGLKEFSLDSLKFDVPDLKFYIITVELEENIKLKMARLLVIIKNIEAHGIIAQTAPELKDILQGKIEKSIQILYQSSEDIEIIKKRIFDSGEVKNVKIDLTNAETIKEMITELDKEEQNGKKDQDFQTSSDLSKVKVDLQSLDKLIELYGEILIRTKQLENKIQKYNEPDINEIIFQIQNYMFKFQDIVFQIQMVPISSIFRIFPRMVRNLAKQENKEVDFIIKTHNVKVDRKILNEIGTIVNHLLRNSINHGIETLEKRQLIGKPLKGTITLETMIQNNLLTIEVNDDGRGIDPKIISKAAIKQKIVSKEEIGKMTPEEIIDLIYAPKLSTASEITNISGRGIGMNIIKEKIQSLNGSISIETEELVGTTFTIILPISRLLIRAILVKSGNQIFSIALDDIERLYEIPVSSITRVNSIPFIRLPDESDLIKIIDIGQVFKMKNFDENTSSIKVVYLKRGNNKFGLVVDEFLKESEIVIKEITDMKKKVKGISGAAILEDGTVSLVIDPFRISNY